MFLQRFDPRNTVCLRPARPLILLPILAAFGWMLFGVMPAEAAPSASMHELTIRIVPEEQRLEGRDEITVQGPAALTSIRLSRRAQVEAVTLGGRDVDFQFRDGHLKISTGSVSGTADPVVLTVRYRAVFDDPVPVHPLNTDNPGFGVTGSISPLGTFLLAGSGWYPEIVGTEAAYRVRVEAPAGILAVTAGKSRGHFTRDGKTVSVWEVRRPLRGLSLSAGPYILQEIPVGEVTAAAYFFSENRALAEGYLDAVQRYLRMYSERFGPYPFEKFAVVENFFPTGYGFPSYTLLGSRVLRLPFIKDTSLGHEVAHCWWGNGVLVDPSDGNWSEGLTTYVADYLYKELVSEKAASDYRRQILRDYASLVGPEEDFALDRFRSRTDPVTRVVGYGKAAMVFHMLRKSIGEEAFWGALRDLFAERLFRPTGWDDLRRAFEARYGRSLETFFAQWVRRPGAARLLPPEAGLARSGDRWRISGALRQAPPTYHALTVEVSVLAGGAWRTHPVALTGESTAFSLEESVRPERISLDPHYHLFRKLYPKEIPPSVNAIRGASPAWVVLTADGGKTARKTAQMLVQALGLQDARIVSENRLPAEAETLLIVGTPRMSKWLTGLPAGLRLDGDGFHLNGERFFQKEDALFAVFRPGDDPDAVRAVFAYGSPEGAEAAVRKIPHYGRYSYLAFTDGRNRVKGVWPVTESPLILPLEAP
ncbi:MAG: M1 family peptidase [Desulfobacteraceae bacterium]|nr:M1 family peptidase [Desulfobacteraceae bacterium]